MARLSAQDAAMKRYLKLQDRIAARKAKGITGPIMGRSKLKVAKKNRPNPYDDPNWPRRY